MNFKFTSEKPKLSLPDGFYYISQDNYYIVNLNNLNPTNPEKHLYADSATSCIIIVVEGKDKDGNPIVALSHLSRKERFLKFFEIVEDTFYGSISIFAQGANPPQPAEKDGKFTFTSLDNAQTVINWVNDNVATKPCDTRTWYINQFTLSLGLGNPQIDDRGCYGIDLTTMTVSNQRFILTDEQRDPTGGIQTLFCVFGLKVCPQIVLPLATSRFTPDEVELLVNAANGEEWTSILKMTKDEVLQKYSSTPLFEVPWFFASLRSSAMFVHHYNQKNN